MDAEDEDRRLRPRKRVHTDLPEDFEYVTLFHRACITLAESATSSFTSQQVTIVVGADSEDELRTFYAHEKILAKNSDFFAATLRNRWSESKDRIVRLPDHTAGSFELFLRFIYRGDIRKRADYGFEYADTSYAELMVRCWALGEKMLCTAFQDAVMDVLQEEIFRLPATPDELHESIYSFTSTPNALSRLWVDIAFFEWNHRDLREMVDPAKHGEFLLHLAGKLLNSTHQDRQNVSPYDRDTGCEYHEHVKKGLPCYK